MWTVPLSPHQLISTWLHSRLSPPPGLALGWLLSSGFGDIVTDTVHSHRLSLSVTGAVWVHVDVRIFINVNVATSVTSIVYQKAHSFCAAYLNRAEIHQTCGSLAASLSFFTAACVQDVIAGQGVDWSMSAVLTFTSQCQVMTGVSTWPGQLLCNLFPSRHFPIFSGQQCDKRCIFGDFDNTTQTCVCDVGYWGEMCDQQCLGEPGNPCSGHGVCQQDSGRSVNVLSCI